MIRSIEIGVRDIARARRFYLELLGLPESMIILVRGGAGEATDPPRRGILHAGWVVENVDQETERLRAAGVEFVSEPSHGTGVDRFVFLRDPDGSLLELVQGTRRYQCVAEPELVEAERVRPRTLPTLDHVAILATHLDQTLGFYYEEFGYRVLGENKFGGAGGGTAATYLNAGDVALEIFTQTARPQSPPPPPSPAGLGIRSIRIHRMNGTQESMADPDGAHLKVSARV